MKADNTEITTVPTEITDTIQVYPLPPPLLKIKIIVILPPYSYEQHYVSDVYFFHYSTNPIIAHCLYYILC